MLLVMIDRGHRELPIQPDFCGRKVPTSKKEIVHLRLKEVDGEDGIFSVSYTHLTLPTNREV